MDVINLTSTSYRLNAVHNHRPKPAGSEDSGQGGLGGADERTSLLGGYIRRRSGRLRPEDHGESGPNDVSPTAAIRSWDTHFLCIDTARSIGLHPVIPTSSASSSNSSDLLASSGYTITIPGHVNTSRKTHKPKFDARLDFGSGTETSSVRSAVWTECAVTRLSYRPDDRDARQGRSREGVEARPPSGLWSVLSGCGRGERCGARTAGTVIGPVSDSGVARKSETDREGGWSKLSDSVAGWEKSSPIVAQNGPHHDEPGSMTRTGRTTVGTAPFRAFFRASELNSPRTSLPISTSPNGRSATLLLIPRSSSSAHSFPSSPNLESLTMARSSLHAFPTPTPLSTLPSDTPLTALLLPGTHQSLSRHGWPIAQCQEKECSVRQQLEDGVRFLDVRLNLKGGKVVAYHSFFPQYTPFPLVLSQISAYFRVNPLETVIMCIQEEAGKLVSPLFSQAIREDMRAYIERGGWWLENRVPTLGQVRGKAVLMSRFGGGAAGESPWAIELPYVRPEDRRAGDEVSARLEEEPGTIRQRSDGTLVKRVIRMGWRPNRWPDTKLEGFTWDLGPRTLVDTQDWYDISGWFNIPAKFEVVRTHLLDCAREASEVEDGKLLCMSFTSASSVPFALPETVARGFGWPRWGLGFVGVNERLRDWLLDKLEQETTDRDEEGVVGVNGKGIELRGIVPMDFYRTGGLADVMHAFNGL